MRSWRCIPVLLVTLLASLACAQTAIPPAGSKLLVVMPFENDSSVPGIDWIGESFPEVLSNRMGAPGLFVISRADRLYAFDRLGIPSNTRPSRATLIQIAEEMDVDYVITGKYSFDGNTFTARTRMMDMRKLRLSPESVETGALTQLLDIQQALAWNLLRHLDPHLAVSKSSFVNATEQVRLDALENYIRGVVATEPLEKIKLLRQAVRLKPDYSEALFLLGKTYFDGKDYVNSAATLAKVPKSDPLSREANFYLGLASFYSGNFEKAEEAFAFVAERLPLIEAYNNLGVASARRGKKSAVDFFQRATAADPRDADYRFNYGLSLYRNGDITSALRQLKEAANLRPHDSEIKSLYEAAGTGTPLPTTGRLPLERIKRNYDEASYRQISLEIRNARELRFANTPRPQHAAAHVERGNDLLSRSMNDEAEEEFREAILLDPTNPASHLGLAKVLEARNEFAAARAEVQSSMQLRGNTTEGVADGYILLASIDVKQNRMEAAQDNLMRAARAEPNHPGIMNVRRAIAAKLAENSATEKRP
ncbi:MAG TPA: tetratricopeptide repeat protein [Terriglobales bacterium]|nr:tetratricopeptide repeat protein [Terriglobales bacterium]